MYIKIMNPLSSASQREERDVPRSARDARGYPARITHDTLRVVNTLRMRVRQAGLTQCSVFREQMGEHRERHRGS